jgi:glucose-1-phosphate thymidylyltransferase
MTDTSSHAGAPGAASRPIANAIILARGLGTRMRERDEETRLGSAQAEAADRGIKAMIPIDRPFLDYVLSALADAGFTDVCLVIGPEHDAVRDYYTRTAPPRRVRVTFAIQPEPRGTADALLAAESFTNSVGFQEASSQGACFLVMNGDNYYPVADLRRLRELDGPGTVLYESDALVQYSNVPAERIRAFAIGTVTADGYLARLIEKPDAETARSLGLNVLGSGALVSMNCWRLPPAIFDICRRVVPSARGELELPNAIRDAVERDGLRIRVLRSRLGVLDLSRRGDIAAVTARLRGMTVQP